MRTCGKLWWKYLRQALKTLHNKHKRRISGVETRYTNMNKPAASCHLQFYISCAVLPSRTIGSLFYAANKHETSTMLNNHFSDVELIIITSWQQNQQHLSWCSRKMNRNFFETNFCAILSIHKFSGVVRWGDDGFYLGVNICVWYQRIINNN